MKLFLKTYFQFRIIFYVCIFSHFSGMCQNPGIISINDWENPAVLGIIKEKAYATIILPSEKVINSMVISLNGIWKFKWSFDTLSRPIHFFENDYNVKDWANIIVPGNWQLQGFGLPVYTNITYPFKKDQPSVTSEPPKYYYRYAKRNPVGSYCTIFQVPANAMDKHVFLHFGGVESAMYVWVNGKKVGFSKGAMTPAEFDISSFIRIGENKLAVEVYRWSDGSYLEDIDMWRFSGIHRDVDIVIRPKTYIQDYQILAEPNSDFTKADVHIKLKIENRSSFDVHQLGAKYILKYTINGTGKIQVEADYNPINADIQKMPKFGMRVEIDNIFNKINWYGRGPMENYPDRKTGSLIGLYVSKIENFISNYVTIQGNANRCDARWFSFSDEYGKYIKITGLQPLCFHAWPYDESDLEKANHQYELPKRDFIDINIDLNIHGVGGNDSWGAKTMEKYTIDGNLLYKYDCILKYVAI